MNLDSWKPYPITVHWSPEPLVASWFRITVFSENTFGKVYNKVLPDKFKTYEQAIEFGATKLNTKTYFDGWLREVKFFQVEKFHYAKENQLNTTE